MTQLVIFDCDGTLYRQPDCSFKKSPFWQEVKDISAKLLADSGFPASNAEQTVEDWVHEYKGELSQAFVDHGITDQMSYFARTWGAIDPLKYIVDPLNPAAIEQIAKNGLKVAILSAAPLVWTRNVLESLSVLPFFEDAIWSGEGDIRKPHPESFYQVIDAMDVSSLDTTVVGNEEEMDIIPARNLNLYTVCMNPYGRKTVADHSIAHINEICEVFR
ncbi:MAG: HAD family hydrolase [Nanoarchaeota archaeon]